MIHNMEDYKRLPRFKRTLLQQYGRKQEIWILDIRHKIKDQKRYLMVWVSQFAFSSGGTMLVSNKRDKLIISLTLFSWILIKYLQRHWYDHKYIRTGELTGKLKLCLFIRNFSFISSKWWKYMITLKY